MDKKNYHLGLSFLITLYLIHITLIFYMGKLLEEIGRITNILEDSLEEQDWSAVRKCAEDLDDLYNELDKQESGFGYTFD